MMEHGGGSLESLILVVTVSFLIPILLYKLRLTVLPVVVAEIIAGLIMGKSGFNLVKEDPWVSLLSLLGFIYLMFLSGLEIDFTAFRSRKGGQSKSFNPVVVAAAMFTGMFVLSGAFSYGLYVAGYTSHVFLMTLIIGTISLGVVVPVLKERKIIGSPLGQTLLLATVLADFVTMIMLALYVSALSRNMNQMLLLLLFFVLVAAIYMAVRKLASGKLFAVLSGSSVQFGTRAIFALLLVIVFISDSLGVENILGAFLAGVIVSLLRPEKAFVHQLESFGYGFLIPIFFVMVGVNLELGPLLQDAKLLVLIPLLLAMIFFSKLVPALLLRRWFGWRDVVSSGVLLSSTLSLVIAAATLALDLHMIDKSFQGALILVAILSCVLFPVISNKLAPKAEAAKRSIAFIGMNHVSTPVASDLSKEGIYDLRVFTTHPVPASLTGGEGREEEAVVRRLDEFTEEALEREGAFDADVIVLAAMDDDVNIRLARAAGRRSDKRVLVRIEQPERQAEVSREGFEVFSTLFAARTVLRALIDNPGALQLISESEESIREITVANPRYHMALLRQLPLLDRLLILRIYRGESFLVPHGNTEIRVKDRLLVSGDPQQLEALRERLA